MKSAILITTVVTGLSLLPAKAQAQFTFGLPQLQSTPVIVVSPLTEYYPNDSPGPGFYQYSHYFRSTELHLDFDQYDYLLSDNLVYDFPVAGNFKYK